MSYLDILLRALCTARPFFIFLVAPRFSDYFKLRSLGGTKLPSVLVVHV